MLYGHEAAFVVRHDPLMLELYVHRYEGQQGMLALRQTEPGRQEWEEHRIDSYDEQPLLRVTDPLAVRAIEQAAREFMLRAGPDPGTEAKVLREWLAVEQARVDRLMEHG